VAEIFAREGEAGFRRRERACLQRVLSEGPAVVATGGGAWLDRRARHAALREHTAVALSAPVEVLRARLQGGATRPLLAGAPNGSAEASRALEGLLEARRGAYAEVHTTVAATGAAEAVAAEVVARVEALGQARVVPLGVRSYRVGFGPLGALPARMAAEGLGSPGASPLVVTDRNVWRAQRSAVEAVARGLGATVLALPPGERTKRLATLPKVWDALLAAGADRASVLVAVGGGVVSDLVGLAAALYLRGIRFVAAPTTLLAMADAAVGGKTAVDLPQGKNLVGAFHQPTLVQVDAATLDTLGGLDYAAGLAEVVKVALAVDPELLVHLESQREALAVLPRGRSWASGRAARAAAIAGAVQAKIDVVARDEREEGERAVLNFGHTLGHCVEHASGYRLRHGLAVAAGMAAALEVGVRIGVTPTELRDRALALLRALGLPLRARVPREAARAGARARQEARGKAGSASCCCGGWATPPWWRCPRPRRCRRSMGCWKMDEAWASGYALPMREKNRSRLRGLAALVAGVSVAMGAGCAEDGPSFFIRAAMAPLPMGTTCGLPLDPNGLRVSEGRLDVTLRNSYAITPLLQNQLLERADQTAARIESNHIMVEGYEIELRDLSPTGSIIGGQAFSVFQSAVVPAGIGGQPSFTVTSVTVIPPTIVQLLLNGGARVERNGTAVTLPGVCEIDRTGVTPNCPVPRYTSNDVRVIVRMRAFGRTVGDVPVQTPYFDFPVTVCCHCLVRFPPEANVAEMAVGMEMARQVPDCNNGAAILDQSSCTPGQDFNLDCRACSSSNVEACQPRGYTRDPSMGSCPTN
jgi:shikimate kinase/3-dehydroquinate synthase